MHERPDYYVHGTQDDLDREPANYLSLPGAGGRPTILAHGRFPYFPGWPDTLQLNYGEPALCEAMRAELLRVAGCCDGVRCDMAMLLLPDVFERTWGISAEPFWPEAIVSVRHAHPEFLFLAEVYWDLEWALQQQGFDLTYDKKLYDRLRDKQAGPVRDHLRADLACQHRLFPDLMGRLIFLGDLIGPSSYDRSGTGPVSPGLYLDLPAWGVHVFDLVSIGQD